MSEIVVTGNRSGPNTVSLDGLGGYRLPVQNVQRLGISGGGGGGGRAIAPVALPVPSQSAGPRLVPTAIRQPRSALGVLTGTAAPKGYGVNLSVPFKKGGLAVKPVWEKKRPEDLNKPKSLSVKKKKSAKARAKAAGRPYPNLVDNLAAARKK